MNVPAWLPLLVVGVCAVVAGVAQLDQRRSRVVNLFTLMLLLTGIGFNVMSYGAAALWGSTVGASLGFACILPFYLIGAINAGDVKLIAATGAWLGIRECACVLAATGVLAVANAGLLAIRRGGPRCVVVKAQVMLLQLRTIARHVIGSDCLAVVPPSGERPYGLPFAVIVALAVLALILWQSLPAELSGRK